MLGKKGKNIKSPEAAEDNLQFYQNLSKLIFPHIPNAHYYILFRSKSDTTNIVKTCDYLYLSKEKYFPKPLKISEPVAGRKLRNKNRVKQS